jgi:histidinol phosphatase-like PHP family hydrolase
MKKILSLLLLVPLASIAAEHGGKAMQKRAVVEQAEEQGEKEMEKTDHAETAAEQGEMSIEEMKNEHAGKPAEHAGTPVK